LILSIEPLLAVIMYLFILFFDSK